MHVFGRVLTTQAVGLEMPSHSTAYPTQPNRQWLMISHYGNCRQTSGDPRCSWHNDTFAGFCLDLAAKRGHLMAWLPALGVSMLYTWIIDFLSSNALPLASSHCLSVCSYFLFQCPVLGSNRGHSVVMNHHLQYPLNAWRARSREPMTKKQLLYLVYCHSDYVSFQSQKGTNKRHAMGSPDCGNIVCALPLQTPLFVYPRQLFMTKEHPTSSRTKGSEINHRFQSFYFVTSILILHR